jgi:hypothetical protein
MSRKNDESMIREYFKQQGCELLGHYKNAITKMPYKCSCGTLSTINWNKFSSGRRCGFCEPTGRKKKYTLQEVQDIFRSNGWTLLEAEYIDRVTKMKYRCKCCNEAKVSLGAVLGGQTSCIKCVGETRFGPKNHMWLADRKQKKVNYLFRQKCYRLLRRSLEAFNLKKESRTHELLGYSDKDLMEHVTHHPNWQFVKDSIWHLDHIFPIQAFLDNDIRDMALINSLDNLRPITAKENRSKNDRYSQQAFLKWLKRKHYVHNKQQSIVL